MRGLNGMIRLAKWQLDEKQRQLADLDAMRESLREKAATLAAEVNAEQAAASTGDAAFAYANFARAALDRRETLERSIAEVETALAQVREQVSEAFRELKKYEVAEARRFEREQLETNRKNQAALDEIALNMHRRKA